MLLQKLNLLTSKKSNHLYVRLDVLLDAFPFHLAETGVDYHKLSV